MSNQFDVLCAKCGKYVGEASVPLVQIDQVGRSNEVKIAGPRDLRVCWKCRRLNVYVDRRSLDVDRSAVVA